MTLEIITMKAKKVVVNSFLYIPSEKRFFWIDDLDYDDNEIIFFFEEKIDKTGLVSHSLRYDKNDSVYVVK